MKINFLKDSAKIFDRLVKLGAVTLGDPGESKDPEKYLRRFAQFVEYFDSAFSGQELISIVKANDCPLVTSYAFHALVNNKGYRPDDKTLQALLLTFASDTNSHVILDWGCSSNPIPMFDYLLSLITDKGFRASFNIKTLDKALIAQVIDKRKPFFVAGDEYAMFRTWDNYRDFFLR